VPPAAAGPHPRRRPPASTRCRSRPELFTTTHFHWPDEACGELCDVGFADVAAFAIEGIASWVTDVPAWLAEPARRERLLAAIRRVESVPALLAASPHVLVVGRAP
jgi:hypothetical protein